MRGWKSVSLDYKIYIGSSIKNIYLFLHYHWESGKKQEKIKKFVDDQYSCDLAISPDIQLKKDTGIEQLATDNRVADIHTISGVRVKRNATTDNLKTLPAGIYIIGNRKVMVKWYTHKQSLTATETLSM